MKALARLVGKTIVDAFVTWWPEFNDGPTEHDEVTLVFDDCRALFTSTHGDLIVVDIFNGPPPPSPPTDVRVSLKEVHGLDAVGESIVSFDFGDTEPTNNVTASWVQVRFSGGGSISIRALPQLTSEETLVVSVNERQATTSV